MTSINGRLPGALLALAGLVVSVVVFTPWAVIGYRDDHDPEVLLLGLRPSEDNLDDAAGPVVLGVAVLLVVCGAVVALTRRRWVHVVARVGAGVLLLVVAGLVAVLWYGVLGARAEVAGLAQPDFVIGPLPGGPVLIDPGVGLWALSAGLLLGLVAVATPGRRRRISGATGLPQLPPPGWYPQGAAVRYWDGRAWTGRIHGHVQP